MSMVAGRRIVEMVWEDLTPDKILTPAAFDNAIKVHMALGGSTNAIIHLIAMARRAGHAMEHVEAPAGVQQQRETEQDQRAVERIVRAFAIVVQRRHHGRAGQQRRDLCGAWKNRV